MNPRRRRLLVSACACAAIGWLGATMLLPFIRDDQLRRELRPNGNANRIRALVSQGASPDLRSEETGRTPLMWAARAGDAALATLLLGRGADPAARDADGRTALAHAAARGDVEMLRLLLAQSGIDAAPGVNEALHAAVSRGNLEPLTLLLASGADPNARVGLHGGTALAAAVRREDLSAVRLLLAAGANPRVTDASDASPLDAAVALTRDASAAPSRERRIRRGQILRLLRKQAHSAREAPDPLSLGPATYTVGPRARSVAP